MTYVGGGGSTPAIASFIIDASNYFTATNVEDALAELYSRFGTVTGGLDWQASVIDKDLTDPPGGEGGGERYIVASAGAGGLWTGKENNIAMYDGDTSSWDFMVPDEGIACWVEDEDTTYVYDGAAWVKLGTTLDHENLTNKIHDGDTLQLDGVNSDGGAFTFNTTGTITFNRMLAITHALAGMLDLNPSHAGTQNVIDITPSSSLGGAGTVWKGVHIDGAALDPGVANIDIYGFHIDLTGVAVGTGPDIWGMNVQLPAAYGAGTEYAAYFSGDGKCVYLCTDVWSMHLTTTGAYGLAMEGELQIEGAEAWIDLNPASTGSKNIIDLTPSAALVAGSTWKGTYINTSALDPATGVGCNIIGHDVTFAGIASVDHDAGLIAFRATGSPSDHDYLFAAYPMEKTGNYAANMFFSYCVSVLSHTAIYRGLLIDWAGATRDANAPRLEGIKSLMPADYTNFGASYAGFFSGDGRSVTICDTTHALNVSGAMNLAGAITAVTTLSMSGQLTNSLAIGTAPFVITSTTVVPNLNVDSCDGYDFDQSLLQADSPTFVGLTLGGAVTGITTLSMSGQLTNTLAIGTPPFVITSTDAVANLNVDMVDGYHLDQDVLQASSPTFVGLTLSGAIATPTTITTSGNIICGGDLTVSGHNIGIGTAPIAASAITTTSTNSIIVRAPYASYYLWYQDDTLNTELIMHAWHATYSDYMKFHAPSTTLVGPTLWVCRGANYNLMLRSSADAELMTITSVGNMILAGDLTVSGANLGVGIAAGTYNVYIRGAGAQTCMMRSNDNSAIYTARGFTDFDSGFMMMEAASNRGLVYYDASADSVKLYSYGSTESIVLLDAGGMQLNTSTLSLVNGELDMTGALACIDLNPASTGNKNVIDITPTAALVAGSTWRGYYVNGAALDPATGAGCAIMGFQADLAGIVSADGDAVLYAFRGALPATETGYMFYWPLTEMTANKSHRGYYTYFSGALSATATYQAIYIDWDAITRDGGAPVLEGVRVMLPASYANYGTSCAGYFSGAGRHITICDANYVIHAAGAMLLNGAITGVNSIACDLGTSVNEFSTDGTLAGNSNNALPTEQAVKTYVDAVAGGAHTHDGDTLQFDGVDSNGGDFTFAVSGDLYLDPAGYDVFVDGRVSITRSISIGVSSGMFQWTPSAVFGGGADANFLYADFSAADPSAAGSTLGGLKLMMNGIDMTHTPLLYGVIVYMPAAYTSASYAGYFSGDGRTVTICDTTYALNVSGAMNLVGAITSVTSLDISGAIATPTTITTSGNITCGGQLRVAHQDIRSDSTQAQLRAEAGGTNKVAMVFASSETDLTANCSGSSSISAHHIYYDVITASSSERIKSGIVELDYMALAKQLDNVRPKEFYRRKSKVKEIGFIAEDLPRMVQCRNEEDEVVGYDTIAFITSLYAKILSQDKAMLKLKERLERLENAS